MSLTQDRIDYGLIALYEDYSESMWASGFIEPTEASVNTFRDWLFELLPRRGFEPVEQAMLDEYKRQEEATP